MVASEPVTAIGLRFTAFKATLAGIGIWAIGTIIVAGITTLVVDISILVAGTGIFIEGMAIFVVAIATRVADIGIFVGAMEEEAVTIINYIEKMYLRVLVEILPGARCQLHAQVRTLKPSY